MSSDEDMKKFYMDQNKKEFFAALVFAALSILILAGANIWAAFAH